MATHRVGAAFVRSVRGRDRVSEAGAFLGVCHPSRMAPVRGGPEERNDASDGHAGLRPHVNTRVGRASDDALPSDDDDESEVALPKDGWASRLRLTAEKGEGWQQRSLQGTELWRTRERSCVRDGIVAASMSGLVRARFFRVAERASSRQENRESDVSSSQTIGRSVTIQVIYDIYISL
jgi:hypothetical protein